VHIEWSVFAMEDRIAIFDYIECDSPGAAIRNDERIRQQIETLAQFPELGRTGRVDATRELIIGHTLYIAAYRITSNTVVVLRILHGAQEWPKELDNP
jgi:toxin ParE1/3/4